MRRGNTLRKRRSWGREVGLNKWSKEGGRWGREFAVKNCNVLLPYVWKSRMYPLTFKLCQTKIWIRLYRQRFTCQVQGRRKDWVWVSSICWSWWQIIFSNWLHPQTLWKEVWVLPWWPRDSILDWLSHRCLQGHGHQHVCHSLWTWWSQKEAKRRRLFPKDSSRILRSNV